MPPQNTMFYDLQTSSFFWGCRGFKSQVDKEQLQSSFVGCVLPHLVFIISLYFLISHFKEPFWRPSLPRTHYSLWSSDNLTSDTKWSTHNHIWSILNHPNRTRLLCYLSSIANQVKLHSLHKLRRGEKITQMYMKRWCHYVSKYQPQTRRLASTCRLQNFRFLFFRQLNFPLKCKFEDQWKLFILTEAKFTFILLKMTLRAFFFLQTTAFIF